MSTFRNRTFVLSSEYSITHKKRFVNTFVRFLSNTSTLNGTLQLRSVLALEYSTIYCVRQRFRQKLPKKNKSKKRTKNYFFGRTGQTGGLIMKISYFTYNYIYAAARGVRRQASFGVTDSFAEFPDKHEELSVKRRDL